MTISDLRRNIDGTWFFTGRGFRQLNTVNFDFYVNPGSLACLGLAVSLSGVYSISTSLGLSRPDGFVFKFDYGLPLQSIISNKLDFFLSDAASVPLDEVVHSFAGCEYRSDLGKSCRFKDNVKKRLLTLIHSFAKFDVSEDLRIFRVDRSLSTLNHDIEILEENDPFCEGLTTDQVSLLLNITGSPHDHQSRLFSLTLHERVFYYGSKIGVRSDLPFTPQPRKQIAPNDSPGYLYELVIQILTELTAPISQVDLAAKLIDQMIVHDQDREFQLSPRAMPTVMAFIDTSPIIFRKGSTYFLMPLESEVGVYGGLYVSELRDLSLCVFMASQEALELLRFPISETSASFVVELITIACN